MGEVPAGDEAVTCEGSVPDAAFVGDPCEEGPPTFSVLALSSAAIVVHNQSFGKSDWWYLAVEILPTESGPRARACQHRWVDSLVGADPVCADAGAITLSEWPVTDPDALSFELEVAMPGFTLRARR